MGHRAFGALGFPPKYSVKMDKKEVINFFLVLAYLISRGSPKFELGPPP